MEAKTRVMNLTCSLAFVFVFLTISGNCRHNKTADKLDICRKCLCTGTKVDCTDQGITTFFSTDEWKALQPVKPTHVDVSENAIVNVTVIAELPIQVLNLSRCDIQFIAVGSFRDLQEMVVLDLSHNKLTTAKLSPHAFVGRYSPEEYEPLSSMRTLNLAYNDLHSLHQDLFEHMPELTELDISGNPLIIIDDVTLIAISSLPMLKVLRMRSCYLPAIPEKLLHTSRYLERLDISNNRLTAIPTEVKEIKNLLYLNLNQNAIVKLDFTSEDYPGFPHLKKMKELHMCNMPELRWIGPGALAGLESLESLHMSWNPKLSYIDPKALARPDDIGETYDYPVIKELYLQSNNLSMIDSRMLARWDLLEDVDVSGNPWVCDCTTQWMVNTLVPIIEAKNVNASLKLECRKPIKMFGQNMLNLHDNHRILRCLDKDGDQLDICSIMLGFVLGHMCFFCIRKGPTNVFWTVYKRALHHDRHYHYIE